MGTWGTAIYSDDMACDVRDDYRELIGDGLSSEDATKRLLGEYSDTITDVDEGPVFWIALASVQWNCGRLLDDIKMKALEIIDSDVDLERWKNDKKLMNQRKEALLRLKSVLLTPQPQPKRIPKVFRNTCEFEVKDAVSFRLASGKHIIMKVIHLITDKGGTHPLFEVCDWVGLEVPTIEQINELQPISGEKDGKLAIGAVSKKEYPRDRLEIVAKNSKTNFNGNPPYTFILWREIDRSLEQLYGFR